MSQILPGIQSLNPFEKFWFWALMVAIYVMLQSANYQFINFIYLEKDQFYTRLLL